MTTRDEKFVDEGVSVVENKIFSYIDSDWRPVSLFNPLYKDVFVEDGIVKFTTDSSFDGVKDAIVPVINLASQDNSGNDISWSSSRSVAYGPPIVKIVGSPPLLTIVPLKNDGDDTRSDNITLIASVNNTIPDLGYDSWDPVIYDNSVRIDLSYGSSSITIDNVNTLKAYQLIDMGSPAVEYVSRTPFTLPSGFEGFDWSKNGDRLFILSNGDDRVYQYPVPINYDVSEVLNESITFDVYKYQGTDLSDIKISKDGERMYVLDKGDRRVRQYDLSIPYDVSSSRFLESFHQADRFSNVGFVKHDGTNTYSLENNIVYQWDINVPYSISSTSYDFTKNATIGPYISVYTSFGYTTYGGGRPFFTSTYPVGGYWRTRWEHIAPQRGLCFSNDGKYLYTASGITIFNGEIERRELSTPWDISTANQDQRILHEFGVATASNFERNYKDNELSAIRISSDGTKFFILDKNTAAVYQFNLPVAYSINSLNPTIKPVPKGAYEGGYDYVYQLSQIPNPTSSDPYTSVNFIHGLEFNESGDRMYVSNGEFMYEYNLAVPFSLENVQYIGSQNTSDLISERSVGQKSNDSISKRNEKFYIHNSNTVYEFDIDSSLQTLDIPYNTKSFYVDQESLLTSFDMNDSGTRMYIGGSPNDNIHQYELSDPYEIYSASYTKSFDTPSDITNLQAISVEENSEKMFGVNANGFVYEFDMDITNLDSSQYNSVFFQSTGNNTSVTGMRFNQSGDFFYLGGNTGIDAYRTKNIFRVKPI